MLTLFYGLFFREQAFKLKTVILSAKLMHFQASPCGSTHLLDDQDNSHKTKLLPAAWGLCPGPFHPIAGRSAGHPQRLQWGHMGSALQVLGWAGGSTTHSSRVLGSAGEGGQAGDEPGLPVARPGVERSCPFEGH